MVMMLNKPVSSRSRRTRESARTSSGAVLQFIDHESLHERGEARSLILEAEALLASSSLDREEELTLFRALHACGFAVGNPRRGAPARWNRERVAVLHQRICERIINDNLGLVYEMKRRFKPGWEMDGDDLTSEGLWTLYQSVTSFNPWKGFRFTTYACRSILRRFVWVGQRRKRHAEQINELRERMEANGPALASGGELDREIMIERLQRILRGNKAGLTPTEQIVLQRRVLHPVNAGPETLESVGRLIKLSRERVRQIQAVAIEKIRGVLLGAPDSEVLA